MVMVIIDRSAIIASIEDGKRYDVTAADNGELVGDGVYANVARFIVGCLDCLAIVTEHAEEPATP